MYDTDNNIKLKLKYKNFNEDNNINWDKYSREIFDSINIDETFEEFDFKKEIKTIIVKEESEGINPFIEEIKSIKNMDNIDKTLETGFIESWDTFKLKDLQKVAEYYEIPYKGKTKNKLIEKIIEFEENDENCMKVYEREVNWNNMNQLSKDKFFSKFIINWNN